MKKISRVQICKMKIEIYENAFGAEVDDGEDEMEAETKALDYVNSLTDKEIIEEYEDMTG